MRFLSFFLTTWLVCAYSSTDVVSSERKHDAHLQDAAKEFTREVQSMGIPSDGPGTVTRAGQLAWHGRVFEDFRNNILDAVPHEIKQRGGENSLLHRNQFGFNTSGPVLIPHLLSPNAGTFFSMSYEGVRENVSRTFLRTVPTTDQRAGDFSQTVDSAGKPLLIYDPATTRPNPAYDPSQPVSVDNLQYLRDPFPNNTIPVSRMDPAALKALALYPGPNTNAGPFFQNNFFVNSPATNLADGVLGKLDQQFNAHQRLTLDFNLSNGFSGSPRWFSSAANPGSPDQDSSNRRSSLQYIWAISPRTVNTAAFQITRTLNVLHGQSGTPFPVYDLSSYVGFGTPYPLKRNGRTIAIVSDEFASRLGAHSIDTYIKLQAQRVDTFAPKYPSGYFQFSSGLTSLPGVSDTGDPFASFLLGLPQYAEQTYITSRSYFRDSYAALGFTDKYQISRSLRVTLGMTASRHSPRTEKYNHQSTVDPNVVNPADGLPGALVFAGADGIPNGLRPVTYHLDPAASITWNPRRDAKTAVRMGFARSHSPTPLYSGEWATQGFNARQSVLSANTQLTPAVQLSNGLGPLPFHLPDLNPDAAYGPVADWMDLSSKEPLFQSASLSIERQLPLSLVASVGASFSGGHDLLVGNSAANPNAINPSALSFGNLLYDKSFDATLRPYPQYQALDLNGLYPIGRYQRQAASVRVEKRASNGLSLVAYYEFSGQFDDYSSPYGVQDFFNRRNDWAATAYNPRQYFQLSYVYDLPIGADKAFLNYGDWRHFFTDGWSVSGAIYMDDGSPLALHPEFNNTGGIIPGLTVNTVPGVNPAVSSQTPDHWFNPAAFAQPADFTLGDAPSTSSTLLGPGTHNFDISLVKRFEAGNDCTVEFSSTAFNILNHGDWNYPDTMIGSAASPNLEAGKIIGSHGGRVVQFGLTFDF